MNASTPNLGCIQAKLMNGPMELNDEEYDYLYQILSNSPGSANNDMDTLRALPPPSSSSLAAAAGGLVRYLGMVQDMMNPEYYVRGSAAASPSQEVELTHLAETLGERQPLLLVPIPFSSVWTRPCPLGEDGTSSTPFENAVGEETPSSRRDTKKRDREESVNDAHGEEGACSKKQVVRSPTSTSEFAPTTK
jgi:hypothetical protein